MTAASAIYDPMIPMGWIGAAPADRYLVSRPGAAVPGDWRDVIVTYTLACGITITAERRGFTVYDFAGWGPAAPAAGVATRTGRHMFRTLGSSRMAKPALVQRLRVINAHLTLMHAAAMETAGESPTVMRVGERDLFRQDVDDDGNDYWYQPLGHGLADVVTPTDRNRFGVMPAVTFTTALDWLGQVIAAGALTEFDLLNQAQTAVSTHDYPLAVVAGWTVCELRTRALAHGLSGVRPRTNAGDVCKALEDAGRVDARLRARLTAIRERRNTWLHSGTDPSEAEAIEAMQLAAELLRAFVPSLLLRPTSSLLIL